MSWEKVKVKMNWALYSESSTPIHVVCNVVIDYETEKAVEQGQVDLLINVLQGRLQQYYTLALVGVPNIVQVVHTWNEVWNNLLINDSMF